MTNKTLLLFRKHITFQAKKKNLIANWEDITWQYDHLHVHVLYLPGHLLSNIMRTFSKLNDTPRLDGHWYLNLLKHNGPRKIQTHSTNGHFQG